MAEGGEDGQEKTHEATPRRLEQAREQGDLPRSQDAQTFFAYAGFAVALAIGGAWSAVALGESLMGFLAHPRALGHEMLSGAGGADTLGQIALRIGLATLPFVAAPAAMILAFLIATRGIVAAQNKIEPKLNRISPLSNAKQKYGVQGLVEFAKAAVKLTAIGVVLAVAVHGQIDLIAQLAGAHPRSMGALLGRQFWSIMTGVLIVTAAIAGFDFIWQRLSHLSKMRMSHQELKEEMKQAEGDPMMRQVRRERARQIATNRMMLDVKKADVVVANPTHVAVALAWERKPGAAPRCLAKGVDEIALRIRAIAGEAGVPVHEDAPTARSIHALVEIGDEIRPEHYKAVAAAILFADKLRERAAR